MIYIPCYSTHNNSKKQHFRVLRVMDTESVRKVVVVMLGSRKDL